MAGPVALLVASPALSLTWALPGGGRPVPSSVPGVMSFTRPDGTVLAVHATRAAAAAKPPLVVVHGGPGVADMEHDVPAFPALAVERDV